MKRPIIYGLILCAGFLGGYAVARIRAVPYQAPPSPPLDLFNLKKFRDADQGLKADVVFFGDSIIELWNLDEYFPAKGYVNRGIKSQTTVQLLGRFEQDVIGLHPRAVVLNGGFNDLLFNIDQRDTLANIDSMMTIARAHGIKVILLDIPPLANEYLWTESEVAALNAELHKRGAVDSKLTPQETTEGPHPTAAGYLRMSRQLTPLLESKTESPRQGRTKAG